MMSQLLMRRPNLDGLPDMPHLPSEWSFRHAQPDDAASMASLLASAFEDETWSEARVKRELTEAPDVKSVYAVAEGKTILATASARLLPDAYPGSGYVHWVAALPGRGGKGLGYAVTLATLHCFRELGCRDAVLETDDERLAAISTYRKLGFEPEHRDESHAARWTVIDDLLKQKHRETS